MAIVSSALAFVAVLAAGVAAGLAVAAMIDMLSETGRFNATRRRVAGAAADAGAASYVAIPPDSGRLGAFVQNTRVGQGFALDVSNAGLHVSASETIRRTLVGALAALLVGTLMTRSLLPGLVLAIGLVIAVRVWIQSRADKRLEQMRKQLPDAFTVVGSSLSSGLSLAQALEYAAKETPEPLGPELWRLVNDVSAGRSLSEALERFRSSVPLRELRTISTAIEIQHRSGGNLREMLDQATASVRQSLELRMSLQSQTAQERLSSQVVGLMPLLIMGVISRISKNYFQSFLGSPVGLIMFSGALLLDFVGYAIIRRIMAIEV